MSMMKGRIAEALVESVFRQAGWTVSRLGRESQVQRLMKLGADEFTPDFLMWKRDPSATTRDAHFLLSVEVKYRAHLDQFLRHDAEACFTDARRAWPDLYFVLVTDRPDPGRSCFQGVSLAQVGTQAAPVDLHDLTALGIHRTTVNSHEVLAQTLFGALGGGRLPARPAAGPSQLASARPNRSRAT